MVALFDLHADDEASWGESTDEHAMQHQGRESEYTLLRCIV